MEDIKKESWKGYQPSDLSLDMTKHILNEAQSFLAFVNENSNRITHRAYTLLAILIAFLSVIYSFLWNSILNDKPIIVNFWMICMVIILIFFPLYLLGSIIFPRDTKPNGRRPKDVNVDIFNHIPIEDQREKYFLMSEIKVYNFKIEATEEQNILRLKKFRRAIYSLGIIALLILIMLLFTLYF